jgi:amidohydrolase
MTTTDDLKRRACDIVDRHADALVALSRDIHAHPELGFEEHYAHERLTDVLAEAGLPVVRHAHDLETAFVADAGRDGPLVAVLCEYDALPGIGHACGHNIIATAGLGAGLALAALAADAGGRVRLLGTPAEEGGGGKILLADRGAFDGVDAAMMVHPADADLQWMTTLALQSLEAVYEGRAAHAAAFPWDGRNALDAAVLGYVNVAALRQHLHPGERVHGVVLEGGDKANIVPRRAAMSWIARSPTLEGLAVLKGRVQACLEAGATAAGCSCDVTWASYHYADVRDNGPIAAAFAANASRLGRTVARPAPGHEVVASTDMGNVSHLVPSIHPMLQVAPAGTPIHTPEFAVHAASPSGDKAVVDGAKALAMTAIDLWVGPSLAEAQAAFAAG